MLRIEIPGCDERLSETPASAFSATPDAENTQGGRAFHACSRWKRRWRGAQPRPTDAASVLRLRCSARASRSGPAP
jgi:hypothetical protein